MFTRPKVLVAISFSSAVFLLVALFLLSSNLGRVIRNGLVILGPVVTRTAWAVQDVDISPWGGEGRLEGLTIGNPPGYFRQNAVDAPSVIVDVEAVSYFDNALVIERFSVVGAEVRFEIAGQPMTNLGVILDSLEAAALEKAVAVDGIDAGDMRSVVIRRFEVIDAVVIGQSQLAGELRLSVPDLILEDVGAAEGGVDAVEAIKRTLGPALEAAGQTIRGYAAERGDDIQRRLDERIQEMERNSDAVEE